jgi:hypothetical protein
VQENVVLVYGLPIEQRSPDSLSSLEATFAKVGRASQASSSPNVFIKGDRTPEELFCLFETACDAGVGHKVKLNHGCRGALEIKLIIG